MTIDDQNIIMAGAAAWGAALADIGALWKSVCELEKLVARIQNEKSAGAAAIAQLEACPYPSCPYRSSFMLIMLMLFLSGCAASQVPQHFDKRVLIVFKDETPKTFTSSLAVLIQPFTKLIFP